MATKTVHFSVDVRNVAITSGTYEISCPGDIGDAAHRKSFHGNTFSVEIKEHGSAYLTVTVLIQQLSGSSQEYVIRPVH